MSDLEVPLAVVLAIHNRSLELFGGAPGVRDMNILKSALAQPYQSVFGEDLYPGAVSKAARLCYGIVAGHPFVDGNKRTGAALLGAYLRSCGLPFSPIHDDFLKIILQVASGELGYGGLVTWVESVVEPAP